jgi:integrase
VRAVATLPASVETVCGYFASLADSGLKVSTIARRCAAITYAHRLGGFPPPTAAGPVKAVLRGIRRRIGVAVTRKAPATARAIAAMIKAIPGTPAGLRDRALLLLGFAAALRRSELVALDIGDIETVDDGVFVHVRRSKTDQEGVGDQIAIPRGAKLRVVEAIEAWVALRTAQVSTAPTPDDTTTKSANAQNSGDLPPPLFVSIAKGGRLESQRLSDRAVALIVKKWAAAAKLDPKLFSGHSLRAGFVTSALEDGADPFAVMKITRHKRVDTLGIYDRRAKAFKNHAGKGFL